MMALWVVCEAITRLMVRPLLPPPSGAAAMLGAAR
jgi:hypothetical protein